MNTEPLKRFMSRVKTAAQARTHEVRMPAAEANELAACLGEMLAELLDKRSNVVAAPPPSFPQVEMDGGSLKR